MTSFLEHIVEKYPVENRDSLRNRCFVFPSRRASLYFKEILKEKNQEIAFWSPETFSIEEFVQHYNQGLLLADSLQLILKLYKVYIKNGGTEKFDEFYSWGNVLLNDFDQLDRYLLDGIKVYKNLQEVENLEATFGPSEELLRALKSFKKVLDDGKESRLTQSFTENWVLVGKIYQEFKAELLSSGKGYMGLLYRQLAEKIQGGNLALPYQEVVFAGFNAISKAEEVIMDSLLAKGQAKMFFDADHYYLRDDNEEAGHFLRKNRRKWYKHPGVEWVVTNGFAGEKKISIIGVEQQVAQTRAAAELINSYGTKSTAVVMGEESLVAPMLYALPENLGEVNITMGYPVVGSALANLVRAYFKYQDSVSTSKQAKVFVSREQLLSLALQPALSPYIKNQFDRLKSGKSTYLPMEVATTLLNGLAESDKSLIGVLFQPQKNVSAAIDCLTNFLSQEYYSQKEEKAILTDGIRLTLLRHLSELKKELQTSSASISYAIIDKILRESFKQLSTPFSGEPMANLQIMGFLESRALDFKNLVLLSVNEDTIPASSGNNSYIPFNIRKAFGLPTFIDQNAIYAYHFFRLLQRAENITLVYSTQLSATGTGEKSRFIYQLIEKAKSGGLLIEEKVWSPKIPPVGAESLSLEFTKQGPVMSQLQSHLSALQDNKKLTPTQLVDYITCPLKYYFARILKIREPDEETDRIDARIFGNLLHELLEACYTPWVGKAVTATNIDQIIETLPELAETLFEDYDSANGEANFSKNLVLYLARVILENDRQEAPIYIYDLESKNKPLTAALAVNSESRVILGGLIDRLDMIKTGDTEIYRVLDYKTGNAGLKSPFYRGTPIPAGEYVKAHFQDPQYKSGFQLLFYVLVLKLMHQDWKLTGGIVGIRKVNSGIDYLMGSASPVTEEIITLFQEELVKLINEIANPDIPFAQTDDVKRCEYCQFRTICSR